MRDDVDPDGINGRHGGPGYVDRKKSDGLTAARSARPRSWWQVTQADGSERDSVRLPFLHNDEFNTIGVNGVTAVAVKGATRALTALNVLSMPSNPNSALVPLTLQVRVSAVFDVQQVVALPRSTNGTVRYFADQYSPRKLPFTTSVAF